MLIEKIKMMKILRIYGMLIKGESESNSIVKAETIDSIEVVTIIATFCSASAFALLYFIKTRRGIN